MITIFNYASTFVCGSMAAKHQSLPLKLPFCVLFKLLPMLLSCSSSCPAVGSVPSLVSFSFPFVFGFFATGGGTFVQFCAGSVSPPAFGGEETSWFLCVACFVSVTGLVSITTFLLLLAKIKLAVLEGDLRRSDGDVGECRLRRELGPPKLMAAVRSRIASCMFIDGDTEAAGGDLIIRDETEDDDTGGTTRGSDLGAGGCDAATAGGEVGAGKLMIRDFLIGFWGASAVEDEAGMFFLILTSVPGSSCTCGASELLLTDGGSTVCRREGGTKGVDSSCMTVAGVPCEAWSSVLTGLDSCFTLERSCTVMGEGADEVFSLGGGRSGLGWKEFSDGAEIENFWTAGPSVVDSSGWWGSSMGGGGGIL